MFLLASSRDSNHDVGRARLCKGAVTVAVSVSVCVTGGGPPRAALPVGGGGPLHL